MTQKATHSHRALELLAALRRFGGSARNAELARAMAVSEETVRRTVKSLSKSGEVARVYGGAYLVGPQEEPSFFRRIAQHTREKQIIASAVADRVKDGTHLFLDVGSTTAFVAEELRSRRNLSVVTNSIGVAQTLTNHNGNRVFLLGGDMHSDERGVFGSVTERLAQRFVFDLAILSTDGLSAKQGFLYLNQSEANLATVVADCAERVLVALDHFKFDTTAPYRGPSPQKVDELISDRAPKGPLAETLRQWRVSVHQANKELTNVDAK